MKSLIKKIIPAPFLRGYHYLLAVAGAVRYGFPANKLFVVAVTGTKGKSTTVELIAAILRAQGYKVASASTIKFQIGDEAERNLFKMTMPGRSYLQKFLRRAVSQGATHVVMEMTSEGAVQFRHKGIALNALVFTNLAPEHIESHGSFEKYAEAKLSLAKHLEQSKKRPRIIVANADDAYGQKFLDINVEVKAPFSLKLAEPYQSDEKSVRFVWRKGELFTVPLPGVFNLKNILAAMTLAEAMQIPVATMHKALEHIAPIAGRAERVEAGQPFAVVVDYAHTPDSLRALYETFSPSTSLGIKRKLICVLGSTGGGRDTWKRPEMGSIADEFCDVAYLTNEDPYDEDPNKIIAEIAAGFKTHTPRVVLNRRAAINAALTEARPGDAVLISGKGTDPYIMGPHGSKEAWSDQQVAKEELTKLGHKK